MLMGMRGVVHAVGADFVVLDVGMALLRVQTSARSMSSFSAHPAAERVLVHTTLFLRDDALTLYGFSSAEERDLFDQLIGVMSVGPRLAQALLSAFSPAQLAAAIDAEDVTALCRVTGVGRKTAQRLILELRGKLVATDYVAATPTGGVPRGPISSDLITALTGLGFSTAEAMRALQQTAQEGGMSDEDRLRAAIRSLSALAH